MATGRRRARSSRSLVTAGTLVPITLDNVVLVPGPRASRDMHRRLDAMRALRPDATA